MNTRLPWFRRLAQVLIGLMLANPLVSMAAPLAVDAAAGGTTRIGAAGNGVPVVDIAAPNGSGLSHNKFSEYNVDSRGLILNNATQKLQSTELGGYTQGNTNLNGRAAAVILNEVTGTNRSELKGYTEVAGSSARVIVANPHGITCDGCGFINTPQATLTTGVPVIRDGQLKSYSVDNGEILIGGAGIDVSGLDAFDLITRAARINGDIHAGRLSIVTGRNEVDAATLEAVAKADNGSVKPHLAIDSSALGGMYAGAIKLIGTEDGVGFKLSGDMAASVADIEIDAGGTDKRFLDGFTDDQTQFKYLMDNAIESQQRLNLAPGLALSAEQTAALTHDIVWLTRQEINGETVLAPVLYLAQAKDRLAPTGALLQGQDINLISGADLKNSGTLKAERSLQAAAHQIENKGLIEANNQLDLIATGSIQNQQGGLIKGQDVRLMAQNDISNERSIASQTKSGKGFSQTTSVLNNAARIEAGNSLNLTAGRDIQNIGATIAAGGDTQLIAGHDLIIAAQEETGHSSRQDKRHSWNHTTTTQHGSDIKIGGSLNAQAGQDALIQASHIKANEAIALSVMFRR